MTILCDTSSILMLIRIAPEMFIDERFECVTLPAVRDEILRSAKFVDKFPWRKEYKNRIKVLSSYHYETEDFKQVRDVTSTYLEAVGNSGLSRVDKEILVYSQTYNTDITTGDGPLAKFSKKHYGIVNIPVLQLLNNWIAKGLVTINDTILELIKEWDLQDEPVQPKAEIKRFEQMTGFKYPGS